MTEALSYGFKKAVHGSVDEVEKRVTEALAKEGFGVLTRIDVSGTFKAKLSEEFRPYVILGACNPPIAHRALSEEIDIGLLLPCNVVVYAADEVGMSVVSILDPEKQLAVSGRADIADLAADVQARLRRALDSL